MASINLTDTTVRNLKPSEKQITYWDSTLSGFGLMVSPGGSKTWTMMVGKARKRITIGRFPIIGIAEARAEAKKRMAQITLGRYSAPNWPLESLIERFEGDLGSRAIRTQESYRWLLGRLPKHFTVRRVGDITPEDIREATKKLPPSVQSHTIAVLKILFRYAVRHNIIEKNPAEPFTVKPSRTRSRTLSDEELSKVWHALKDDIYSHVVKLLILTGCRKNEIQHLTLEGDIATLPSKRAKNKREHVFPLPAAALPLLDRPLPFHGWSKSKARLDNASGVTGWTLHDLRRTYATIHAKIGTLPHITERLLNHASGTISGVAAVYNRYHYFDEMKVAVTAYERHLATIVGP